jgi:ribose transport system substrate-binding protein
MLTRRRRRPGARVPAAVGALCALLVVAPCVVARSPAPSPAPSATDYDRTYDRVGTVADFLPIDAFCPSAPMKVALADGSGASTWRRIARAEFEDEASRCPNLAATYVDAGNDSAKAATDIADLVAQGNEVIIGYADASDLVAPAYAAAVNAGVTVVPYLAAPPDPRPGKNLTDWVRTDDAAFGRTLAAWTIAAWGGQGALVMLGGTPGNDHSQTVYEAVRAEAARHPGVTLLNLTEGDTFVPTDWRADRTEEAVAGLLAKYPAIDGVVSDYGAAASGGIRAFRSAGRPVPPWASNDSNEFACLWVGRDPADTRYAIATVSSATWIPRVALRRALADRLGIQDPEPQIIQLPLVEDSTATDPALAPRCDPTLPATAVLSAQLSREQLQTLFTP